MFQLGGAIIVNHDLSVMSLSENVLALSGCREVGQGGFSQLQTTSIETIGTIDVNGISDMIDVVENERTTIEEHRTRRWIVKDSFGQLGGRYRTRPLENQLFLECIALGARTSG